MDYLKRHDQEPRMTPNASDLNPAPIPSRYTGEPRPVTASDILAIPITRCDQKNGQTVDALILSQQIHGASTHFIGRTIRCTAMEGDCLACRQRKPRRWTGYLAAYDCRRHRLCLLEVTNSTAAELETRSEPYATMRNIWVRLKRKNGQSNGKVDVENLEMLKPEDAKKTPPAFDVAAALEKLWGKSTAAYNADPFEDSILEEMPTENP